METDVEPAMDPRLLASILGKKTELDRQRPLGTSITRKLNEQFTIEWTYNSNAIEGNTLSLQETELVLSRGLTIGNKSLKEHFEVINHGQAIEFLAGYIEKKQTLDENFILELHSYILKNIDDDEAGHYRNVSVRILGAVHLPPNPAKIPEMMKEFLSWFYAKQHTLSVPILAALVHYYFVYIHPFIDGNGRTARLLMNLVLIQNGFPPAVILNLDRKKYYRVLRKADQGDLEDFVNFVGKAIERSLVIYLNTLSPANEGSGGQGYISLNEATKYCEYSLEYLSFLARTGKLPAVKFSRNWMTTRDAVESYVKEVKRNG